MNNERQLLRETVARIVVRQCCEEMRIGAGFLEALNAEVERLIELAVDRAEDNGRKTLRAHDV